ncbi:hypothetical protein JCM9279_003229 [Rhodotorula babjevae]
MAPQKKTAVVEAIAHIASLHKDLAKAHKQATAAMLEYAHELEQAGGDKGALATFPALLGEAEQATQSKKRSRKSVAAGESGDEVEGKKRRGPNKEKKPKDPNAPKRPASAYIEYQNSVREEWRRDNPDLSYAEVLKKIGQNWQNMSDADKEPWQTITADKTIKYLDAKQEYEKTDPANVAPEEQQAVAIATEPKAKRPRKSEVAADIPVDATPKEKKNKAAKKAPSPPKAASPSASESDSEEDAADSSESESEATPPPAKKAVAAAKKPVKASKK